MIEPRLAVARRLLLALRVERIDRVALARLVRPPLLPAAEIGDERRIVRA